MLETLENLITVHFSTRKLLLNVAQSFMVIFLREEVHFAKYAPLKSAI